jgi:hypothetical protein
MISFPPYYLISVLIIGIVKDEILRHVLFEISDLFVIGIIKDKILQNVLFEIPETILIMKYKFKKKSYDMLNGGNRDFCIKNDFFKYQKKDTF